MENVESLLSDLLAVNQSAAALCQGLSRDTHH